MENEIKTNQRAYQKTGDQQTQPEKKPRSLMERSMDRMGKYSWITALNQFLIGIGLVILAIWFSQPFLKDWVIGVAAFLYLFGVIYGWYISKQTEIRLSASGAAIFSYAGLWKKFAPMVVILFILRVIIITINRRGIADTTPFMRTITFFLAGVFTARGLTLLTLIYRLKKGIQP